MFNIRINSHLNSRQYQPRGYRVSFRRFGSSFSLEHIKPNGQRTFPLIHSFKLSYNDRTFQGRMTSTCILFEVLGELTPVQASSKCFLVSYFLRFPAPFSQPSTRFKSDGGAHTASQPIVWI